MEIIAYILLFAVVPIVSGFLCLGVTRIIIEFVSGRTGILLLQLVDGLIAGALGVALFEFMSLDPGFGVYLTLAINYALMEYRRRLMGRPGDSGIVMSQLCGLLIIRVIIN